MSFSATWDGEVCQSDAASDLAIEKATLSPPLEGMADDVRAVVVAAGQGAAAVVATLPSASGLYKVSAYGHVGQGAGDTSSVTINVAEAPAVVPATEPPAA
jgi:predicted ThiF/HesA family dinucleotide-utilizing enzyme